MPSAFNYVFLLISLFFPLIRSNHYPGYSPTFLPSRYNVRNSDRKGNIYYQDVFFVRNVPGDGSCLFHSLAICLKYKLTRRHEVFDENTRELSCWLRELACDVLCGKLGENISFVIEPGSETILPAELQKMLEEKNNIPFRKYIDDMRNNLEVWGGGPGIVVLSYS